MSINRVMVTGNLTHQPTTRSTAGGTCVLSFSVAVSDRVKDPATGEWGDRPNFVDCTMFGSRAESVARYLSKGMKVAVEGKLRYSTWEAQDGSKRSKLEVIVDEIEFMSRGAGSSEAVAAHAARSQPMRPASSYAGAGDAYAADIPF